MKDQERAYVLKDCEFIGDAILEDYALKEVGTFPGAVPLKGHKVYGEIYRIDEEKKKELDYIEGEDYLYKFKIVDILCNGEYIKAGFYEFLKDSDVYPYSKKKGKWRYE
ncbi:MAG: gamma-glutamylcyclotransferase [Erysipelotrichaceae bacterium]|nr:gamma-glutamylcyclotransferase [Erysipelotrichaceae bacterium]